MNRKLPSSPACASVSPKKRLVALTSIRSRARGAVLALFGGLALLSADALAQRTITSVTLNGGSSVTVAPGGSITAVVQVTTAGNGSNARWRCTNWRIAATPPGTMTAEDHGNHENAGSYTETFTVTAPATSGTYNAYFSANRADDCGGNNPSPTYVMANAIVVAPPAPTVLSINRADASPTAALTVQWTVSFSGGVVGVDAGDFALVSAGVSGASIATVAGAGASYTVTANTGTGSGTLGLNLVDNDSINATGTPLGGVGAGNGSFTGQVYAVDRGAPTVLAITRAAASPTSAASVAWNLSFSEDVTGVEAGDFVLVQGGGVTAASISSVTGGGTAWTVTAAVGLLGGAGTLGLDLVDNDSIVDVAGNRLGGTGAGNGDFSGEVYAIDPVACPAPANIPAGVGVTCLCDDFNRAVLNPSTIFNGDWIVSTSDATGIVPSIVSNRLRLTNSTNSNAKAATVPGIFPAAGNYISVEFRSYAYSGSGADGIAVTLSDYSVPAVPGAFGGSLGYAQKSNPGSDCSTPGGCPGFSGGWVGVAIDEFGNFQNPTEGRVGGPGQRRDSVAVRGSGTGMSGYRFLGGTATLNPEVDNAGSAAPARGHRYQVIIDARAEPTSTAIAVNRDTTGTGTSYGPLISIANVYSAAAALGFAQAPVPANWQVSFTGSTGGATNIHEIGELRICAAQVFPPSGGVAGVFNAIDSSYASTVQNFLTGHLFTQLVGAPFALKVAALSNSQIQTAYAIAGNKNVTLKLVDNSDGACGTEAARTCNAACTGKAAVPGGSQTLTFANGDAGVRQSANFTLNAAYSRLLAIISDGTTTACSTDSFAVRPTAIALTAPAAAVMRAGTDPFTLAIDGGAGYNGTAQVANAALQAVLPATVAGTISPTAFPAAVAGVASSGLFLYSEVGSFVMPGHVPGAPVANDALPRGIFDDTWTALDSDPTKQDCVVGSYSNARDASGKVGCNFGITVPATLGRFIPDHFDAYPTITPACAADGFSYMGQPLPALGYTIVAKRGGDLHGDAASGVTQNYVGAAGSVRLTAQNGRSGTELVGRLVDRSAAALANTATVPATGAGTWTAGVFTSAPGAAAVAGGYFGTAAGTPYYLFALPTGSPDASWGPFDSLEIGALVCDADGVRLAQVSGIAVPTAGGSEWASGLSCGGVAQFWGSLTGATRMRHGRLRLENAQGSELLARPVSARLEYFDFPGGGWRTNALDLSCTELPAGAGAPIAPPAHGANDAANACWGAACTGNTASDTGAGWTPSVYLGRVRTVAATLPVPRYARRNFIGGVNSIVLAAPGQSGTVQLQLEAPSWLFVDGGRPTASIRFGTFDNSGRFIFQREGY
jgi:MSHA biogenesis protein MshQ